VLAGDRAPEIDDGGKQVALGGIAAFSGALIGDAIEAYLPERLDDQRVLLRGARFDEWVPTERLVESAEILANRGARLDAEVEPGGQGARPVVELRVVGATDLAVPEQPQVEEDAEVADVAGPAGRQGDGEQVAFEWHDHTSAKASQ
jgi:hypothetical protein